LLGDTKTLMAQFGQMFGAGYVESVLAGLSSERSLMNGHEALSVWGIVDGEDRIVTVTGSIPAGMTAGDLASIEFVLRFDKAMQLMKPGGAVWALREEAFLHRSLKAPRHAAKLARRALRLMAKDSVRRAMIAYIRQVRTTSQRGNLARMCDEAWSAWETTRRELDNFAAEV